MAFACILNQKSMSCQTAGHRKVSTSRREMFSKSVWHLVVRCRVACGPVWDCQGASSWKVLRTELHVAYRTCSVLFDVQVVHGHLWEDNFKDRNINPAYVYCVVHEALIPYEKLQNHIINFNAGKLDNLQKRWIVGNMIFYKIYFIFKQKNLHKIRRLDQRNS